jgi:hypothetical protein
MGEVMGKLPIFLPVAHFYEQWNVEVGQLRIPCYRCLTPFFDAFFINPTS